MRPRKLSILKHFIVLNKKCPTIAQLKMWLIARGESLDTQKWYACFYNSKVDTFQVYENSDNNFNLFMG